MAELADDLGTAAVRLFNRRCGVAAFVLLVGAVTASVFVRVGYQDFGQFYLAGTLARQGAWADLYPTPIPGNPHNPGAPEDSTVSPAYARAADAAGMAQATRFMQVPPAALLYAPLSVLPPVWAYRAWLVGMAMFGWGIAWQAGRVYEILLGRAARGRGWLTLLVACSPLMYRSVRVGNLSPLIGLLIGVAVIDLLCWRRTSEGGGPRPGGARAGVAAGLGALLKYVPAVLAPLWALRGRWAPLAWAAVTGLAAVAVSLAVMGRGPWETFAGTIAPTLGRSHELHRNQAVAGVLLRVTGTTTLPPGVGRALAAAQAAALAAVLGLLIRRRRAMAARPALVAAGAASLLGWALLFAPIFWEHYVLYLCPLWGWLAYEAGRSRGMAIAAAAAVALVYVPLAALRATALPEPLNAHITAGGVVFCAMGLWRLARGCGDQAVAGAADRTAPAAIAPPPA